MHSRPAVSPPDYLNKQSAVVSQEQYITALQEIQMTITHREENARYAWKTKQEQVRKAIKMCNMMMEEEWGTAGG